MACNFIHCFRNPSGDYEWADWDKPPPRYWVKKMAALFGQTRNKIDSTNADMHHYRRSRSREADRVKSGSGRSHDDERQLFMKQLGVGGAPIITVKAEVMRLILMEVGQIGTETNFYVLNLDYLVMRFNL
ncbi:hypothetical protein CICLE_v10013954mg [Citrus x clementina]|uniref:Uncharacterized protein n=1 Tax=Citrus clementina TaxID=85681 RepID=V4TRW0_CITCL|nr:hypothetical protein CICLE_v10013954mg [Citrus x clementina]